MYLYHGRLFTPCLNPNDRSRCSRCPPAGRQQKRKGTDEISTFDQPKKAHPEIAPVPAGASIQAAFDQRLRASSITFFASSVMICTICNNQLCNQMVGMSYSSILIGFLFYHRLFFFSRFFIAILKNFRLF
ncbi:MAG: hypothetical protein IZT75_02010 [Pseudoramibacter alactolyticus]|nr:hypothetical protein [Pseudoramibacter alactolyticus]